MRGWRGDRAAWLAIIGFAVVMFTYLGISMLPTAEESAHVYTDVAARRGRPRGSAGVGLAAEGDRRRRVSGARAGRPGTP